MKKVFKSSIFILIVFVWMIMGGVAHAYDLSAYLPLLDGVVLSYDQTIDGSAVPQVIITTGSDTIVNGVTTKPYATSIDSLEIDEVQYLIWGTDGLQLHQRDEKFRTAADFQTLTGTYPPAGSYRLLLPRNLSMGQNAYYSGMTEDVKDSSGQTVYKRITTSNISLLAGAYRDYLVVSVQETTDIKDPTETTTVSSTTNDMTLYLTYLSGVIQKAIDYSETDPATGETISKVIDLSLNAEVDTDGDGLSDAYEGQIGTNPNDRDSDGDGLWDGEEVLVYGTDPLSNIDSDGDGMSNDWENALGLDPNYDDALDDADSDGVNNVGELLFGADPGSSDTDEDGVSDGDEVILISVGYPITDPANTNIVPDSENIQILLDLYRGLENCSNLYVRNNRTGQEYRSIQKAYDEAASGDIIQTHAVSIYENLALNRDITITLQGGYDCDYTSNPANTTLRTMGGAVSIDAGEATIENFIIEASEDTDSDSMPDYWEYFSGINPKVDDTVEDADLDGLNNLGEFTARTDPLIRKDTDGDRFTDDWEIAYGFNPDVQDPLDYDTDGDGLSDLDEFINGTDPRWSADTDGDGVSDYDEVALQDVGYPNADPTDPNLTPDTSIDSDGDGIPDADEAITDRDSLISCSVLPVRITGATPEYFYTLQDAYDAAQDGDLIQTQARSFNEDLSADRNITVTLEGGFNCDYTNNTAYTLIKLVNGWVNIGAGTVTMEDLIVDGAADRDNDGMSNKWELEYGFNPLGNDSGQDADMDGVSNLVEYQHSTDPHLRMDTDGDRMTDDWEIAFNLDPDVANSGGDDDLDGLTNMDEFLAGTDPKSSDTDGDGVTDDEELALQKVGYPNADPNDSNVTPNLTLQEVQNALNVYTSLENCTNFPVRIAGSNPLKEYHTIQKAYDASIGGETLQVHAVGLYENLDLNRDIIVTIQGGYNCDFTNSPAETYTTIKTVGGNVNVGLGSVTLGNIIIVEVPDTDNDGMPDEWEFKYGLDPSDDTDALLDDDNDGLTNYEEFIYGTDPIIWDTDGDGLEDGLEVAYGSDPLDANAIPSIATGDLNEDGVVDAGDVVLAQRIAMGLATPTNRNIAFGDVAPSGAPDGVIDGADVVVIQRMALGL